MTDIRLAISLVGPFQVRLDGQVVTHFGSDTARALLAYLAMSPDVPHRRDILAGLLWPELPNSDALRNLRVALSRLRDAIGDRETATPFLEVTRSTIALPQSSAWTVDVRRLREALGAVATHDHTELAMCDACADRLRTVDDLYRGEFLAGFSLDSTVFEEWLVTERERLHWEALEALADLTAYHEAHHDYEAAIAGARRQVALEPWRESAHRQWMRALALSGHRNAALAQYEACRGVLADELGVVPEAATTALHDEIRDGVWGPPEIPAQPGPSSGTGRAMPVLPGRLAGATSTAPEPERRTITVVQAEVCGAGELLDRLGVEAWATILSQLLRAAGAEVSDYGGEVERYDDDKLAAFFGVAVAQEDDPERAVLAALAMLPAFEATLRRLALEAPDWRDDLVGLDLRALVHTGEAIVTHLEAEASPHRPTIVGDVVSSSRRYLATVLSGTVLVSAATYRLVAPLFEWADDLGSGADLSARRPTAHKGSAGKGRGIPGLQSPLVGRDMELGILRNLTASLARGKGGIATVVGEAGIGKSRLIAELRAGAEPDLQWVEGRCLSHSAAAGYALWISVLHNVLGTRGDMPRHQVGQTLRDYLAALDRSGHDDAADDFLRGYPFLAYLLDAPQRSGDRAMVSQMDPPALQEAVFSTVERLFEAMARRRALVVICEDLHWSDSLSLQLLERMLGLADRLPVLWVCAFRPERQLGCWRLRETARSLHADRHTDVVLQPLSGTDSGLLLQNLLLSIPGPGGRQTVEGLPATLKDQVLSRSEGNPYYVEELTRSLIESGAIVCDAVTCEWQANSEPLATGIPETLYGVLRGRIDRLPPGARHVLRLASVIGRIFSRYLLAEIADRGGLDPALVVLQRDELVREHAGGPGAEYVFRHQLTRDAAYSSLLRRERRALHRRVAEALERLYPDRVEQQLDLLAHHWEEAGDSDRAIDYLHRAADRAAGQYANTEALLQLERALALTPPTDLERRFRLLCSRTVIWDRLGSRSEQWADISRLAEIVQAPDDGGLGRQTERTKVALLKTTYYEHTNDQDELLEAAQEATRLARAGGDLGAEIEAESAWGIALSSAGDSDAFLLHLERALRLARSSGDGAREAEVLRALALGGGSNSRDEGRSYLQQALQIHRRIGNRAGEATALNALGLLALHRHHSAVAKDYLERGLRLCRETGLYREEGWARATLGWGMHDLGIYDEADRQADAAIRCFRHVKDPNGEVVATVVRAWVARRLGDTATSVALSETGFRLADAVGALEPGIVARLALGDALTDLGDAAGARVVFQDARLRSARFGWSQLVVGARAGLANVAMIGGLLDEAQAHARHILDYTETAPELPAMFHPMRVYLICYRVLVAVGDPAAHLVLTRSYGILQTWAKQMEEAAARRSFLERVVEHRELVAAYSGARSD